MTTLYRLELTATANSLRAAALAWAAMDSRVRTPENDPLKEVLPATKVPTDMQLEAIYEITGKTEAQRKARDVPFTPDTESAWARSMLKRWAVRRSLLAVGWFQHGADREGVTLNG